MRRNNILPIKLILLLFLSLTFISCESTSKTVISENYISEVIEKENIETIKTTFVSADKNGNIKLSINANDFLSKNYKFGDIVNVNYHGKKYEAPIVSQYDDVENGDFLVRVYDGEVELAISYENCINEIYANLNDDCTLSMQTEYGFLTEYEMRHLETSLDRDDYITDETFANFREVNSGNIADGLIYRSSSPTAFNTRSSYTSSLAIESGIATVINLDDNKATLIRDLGYKSNQWYKNLYDNGNVLLADMNADYSSNEFGTKVANAMRFIIENDGPYLIHCDDGKNRTGFIFVVLESLMGASQEEIEKSYMNSYSNLYGIKKGTYQYNFIKKNPYEMLASISKGIKLESENYHLIANNYLLSIGLSKEEISKIITILS